VESSPETVRTEYEVESMVKETVITGAPSQFVSDRNRDHPQTPPFPVSQKAASKSNESLEETEELSSCIHISVIANI